MDDNKKMPKNAKKIYCIYCDFLCSKQSNYATHCLTPKHKKNVNDNKNDNDDNNKMPKNALRQYVCECGISYKFSSGLSRHKNADKCVPINNQKVKEVVKGDESEVKVLTNLVLEVVKHNQDLTNKIYELSKNGTNNTTITNNNNNSNNKTFNLNVFLNETCKDAMNIMDFVDSLRLQLSDLKNVGRVGFVEGISNIIVKNLNALDVTQRPVHCSDSKREVMYIKDEDKWEKENDNKQKLRKAIKRVANKNSKLISEFKKEHPDCNQYHSKYSDQYNKLIVEAMGGSGNDDFDNENKIIKKIAKEVVIDKNY